MDGTADLIAVAFCVDNDGVTQVRDEQKSSVWVQVKSVTRQEFFQAARSGLRPDIKLKVSVWDYQGEAEVEYQGIRYVIYRTYRPENSDEMELYLTRKAGTA